MSVSVDPNEVRYHLQQLGYCDISDIQLMEFIKDLKKLIKHDMKHGGSCCCKADQQESASSSFYAESSTSSSAGSSYAGYYADKENADPRSRHKYRSRQQHSDQGSFEGTVVLDSTKSSHGGHQSRSRSRNRSRSSVRGKSVDSSDGVTRMLSSKKLPSFIKPWNINQQKITHRSDPVSLYHKYQAMWQQQKAPGEDNHSDLRWSIRERMLGSYQPPRRRSSSRITLEEWKS